MDPDRPARQLQPSAVVTPILLIERIARIVKFVGNHQPTIARPFAHGRIEMLRPSLMACRILKHERDPRSSAATRPPRRPAVSGTMGRNVPKETRLMKKTTRLVREGELVAEVAVELRDDAGAWGPVLSTGDAARLDTVFLVLHGFPENASARMVAEPADRRGWASSTATTATPG